MFAIILQFMHNELVKLLGQNVRSIIVRLEARHKRYYFLERVIAISIT